MTYKQALELLKTSGQLNTIQRMLDAELSDDTAAVVMKVAEGASLQQAIDYVKNGSDVQEEEE